MANSSRGHNQLSKALTSIFKSSQKRLRRIKSCFRIHTSQKSLRERLGLVNLKISVNRRKRVMCRWRLKDHQRDQTSTSLWKSTKITGRRWALGPSQSLTAWLVPILVPIGMESDHLTKNRLMTEHLDRFQTSCVRLMNLRLPKLEGAVLQVKHAALRNPNPSTTPSPTSMTLNAHLFSGLQRVSKTRLLWSKRRRTSLQ
jgi:hypothetical protein